jgi:hypothetical protein
MTFEVRPWRWTSTSQPDPAQLRVTELEQLVGRQAYELEILKKPRGPRAVWELVRAWDSHPDPDKAVSPRVC